LSHKRATTGYLDALGGDKLLKTAFVTVTDAGYLPAACCQLKSVSDHLGDVAADLFLVCCDVSADDVANAEKFFADRNMPVRILLPNFVDERIKPINRRWPRAAYLRLYFDLIFDDKYDRLIYLDADTRVRSPLAPLVETDMHGRPVAAVHDFIYYLTGNIRRRRRELMLKIDAPYLQSGVMVFDWPATLKDGALARARKFLEDHPEGCQEAPDQDALNAAFEDKWTPIDPRWNLHETYLNFGGRLTPYLEHYTSTKPWSKKRPARWRAAAAWYANELRDTAWADFVKPQTVVDQLTSRLVFLRFRYGPKLRDAIAGKAPVLLGVLKVPVTRSDDVELPWAPRNRKDVEDMTKALVAEAAQSVPPIRPPESVLDGFARGNLIGLA